MSDPVNHPPHYNTGAIECIDAIREMLGVEGLIAYCRGNALKYIWRCKYKGHPAQDLAKAQWYLKRAEEAELSMTKSAYRYVAEKEMEETRERLEAEVKDAEEKYNRMAAYCPEMYGLDRS